MLTTDAIWEQRETCSDWWDAIGVGSATKAPEPLRFIRLGRPQTQSTPMVTREFFNAAFDEFRAAFAKELPELIKTALSQSRLLPSPPAKTQNSASPSLGTVDLGSWQTPSSSISSYAESKSDLFAPPQVVQEHTLDHDYDMDLSYESSIPVQSDVPYNHTAGVVLEPLSTQANLADHDRNMGLSHKTSIPVQSNLLYNHTTGNVLVPSSSAISDGALRQSDLADNDMSGKILVPPSAMSRLAPIFRPDLTDTIGTVLVPSSSAISTSSYFNSLDNSQIKDAVATQLRENPIPPKLILANRSRFEDIDMSLLTDEAVMALNDEGLTAMARQGIRMLFKDPAALERSPEQLLGIKLAIKGKKDSILILCTGGGKSLIWQVLAMVRPKWASVIVTPYVQVLSEQLQSSLGKGIIAAQYTASGNPPPLGFQNLFIQPETGGSRTFAMSVLVQFLLILLSLTFIVDSWPYLPPLM